MADKKTVIVTGASQGIGAAVTHAFLDRGYNVVATSQRFSGTGFATSPSLALVEGDISAEATAEKITQTAMATFGSIDHVVNNAGIFSVKPFTDYTIDEFRRFVSVNLEGFIFVTQRAVQADAGAGQWRQRDDDYGGAGRQSHCGHSGVDSDDHQGRTERDYPESRERIREGAISASTRSRRELSTRRCIRAPRRTLWRSGHPMGTISDPKDIADAVVYLAEAGHVTGEVLHVDDGAHVGRW